MKELERKVKQILIEDKEARRNDYHLWLRMCEGARDKCLINASFGAVLDCLYSTDLPHYESVSRARRKIQAEHPELKVPQAERRRRIKEQEYREYARS